MTSMCSGRPLAISREEVYEWAISRFVYDRVRSSCCQRAPQPARMTRSKPNPWFELSRQHVRRYSLWYRNICYLNLSPDTIDEVCSNLPKFNEFRCLRREVFPIGEDALTAFRARILNGGVRKRKIRRRTTRLRDVHLGNWYCSRGVAYGNLPLAAKKSRILHKLDDSRVIEVVPLAVDRPLIGTLFTTPITDTLDTPHCTPHRLPLVAYSRQCGKDSILHFPRDRQSQ